MITTTLSWIAGKVNGKLLNGNADTQVLAVSTDTRTIESGAVYLALKGPNFNGHDFIEQPKMQVQAQLLPAKT